jgi:hypothetical protein
MTVEGRCFVRLRAEEKAEAEELRRQAEQALARSRKGLPGERDDIVRYEVLCGGIERLAARARLDGATTAIGAGDRPDEPSPLLISRPEDVPVGAPDAVSGWVEGGGAVVELSLPFLPGLPDEKKDEPKPVAPVAEPWKAEGPKRQAQVERLETQLRAALAGEPAAGIRPSGVPNTILTKTLRDFVGATHGDDLVDAPVIYRDGSRGDAFPLNCLRLRDEAPGSTRVRRFVLLSIRHMDADVVVDGAWFRNTMISLPRPAALTDAVATEQSTLQLDRLCSEGPVQIHLYQTGLDSAIVGFYRAVVRRLMREPKSLSVVPYFFREGRGGSPDAYEPGAPWAV